MKRILTSIITVLLLLSVLGNVTMAALPETVVPNESSYLISYLATAATGNNEGEIRVTITVRSAKANLTEIGASKIVVCRSDGTPIRTYYGSTTNGLLSSGVYTYSYTYAIPNLEPSTSYYAQVTVIAADSSGSDTRTVTTNTVKAGS